jgi:hypothetical protein
MPKEFVLGTNDVSDKFVQWAKPLVGRLPEMVRVYEIKGGQTVGG